ncbi:hypothetical protein TFLX_04682 [Thermoflexales bacterium]|nr:hypothetical protein TFLX_04682 [Thermoflexales bacterium]
MKLAVNASPAELALPGQPLSGWRERPAAEIANYLAELGLSATARQTAERLVVQLSSAESSPTEQKALTQDMLLASPITWKPSVLYPVFASKEHFDESDGAPGPLNVFYPSLGPFADRSNSLLENGPYPLVIFLHGHCPSDTDHYQRWTQIPTALARSGYVVVAPKQPHITNPWGPDALNLALAVLKWMQNDWEHREHLVRAPGPAVVGHSYGALLGARLASQIGASAYVGLSGGWSEFVNEWSVLRDLNVPSLFTWGSGDDVEAQLDRPQLLSLWNTIRLPKHKLVFKGGAHFDYLYSTELPCNSAKSKGPCSLVPSLAADYAALFLSRYIPPAGAGIKGLIPPTLVPPFVHRTALQDFFATGHLEGVNSLPQHGTDCLLDHVVEPQAWVDRFEELADEVQLPSATGAPTAAVIPGLGVYNIAYRDTSNRLFELWRDAQGVPGATDLTTNAGAPKAVGNPFAYVDTARNTEILLFRDSAGTVRSLYWSTGSVGHDNLSGTAGSPKAAGDPVGYYVPATDTHHVIYRTSNGHLHELWWTGVAPVQYGGDLTALASAPPAVGQPSAFYGSGNGNLVIYRSSDGHIRSLFWDTGAVSHEDLSGFAGTPPALGDPFAYYTPHNDAHQIVYLGNDGHVWELYWHGVAPVVGWNLTGQVNAPTPAGALTGYYNADTNIKHVFYCSTNGRLHDLWWVPGGGIPARIDLTEVYQAPASADSPAAFMVEGANTEHIAYRGTNNRIYEIFL